eukprot:1142231-Pyramimonas_sp.AAC.1
MQQRLWEYMSQGEEPLPRPLLDKIAGRLCEHCEHCDWNDRKHEAQEIAAALNGRSNTPIREDLNRMY